MIKRIKTFPRQTHTACALKQRPNDKVYAERFRFIMKVRAFLFALSLFVSSGSAQNALSTDGRLERIRAFIAAASKATAKHDLSYKIKIPERVRRQAIEQCNDIIAQDKTSVAAYRLREDLMCGEGQQEAVAVFHNVEKKWHKEGARIFEVLRANMIECGGGGSRGFSVNVSHSHAASARRVLAEIILAEHLDITLTKSTHGGNRSAPVEPKDALNE